MTLPPPTPVAIRTLQSPPVTLSTTFACTIANVSAEPVSVQELRLIGSHTAVDTNVWCATPIRLQPGQACMVASTGTYVAISNVVTCRVKHTGAAGGILGSLTSSEHNVHAVGNTNFRGTVTLQALSGQVAP